MYEACFGLRERPFELVPNPRFLFLTPGQREAFSSLRYGLTSPRGLTLLLGDAGMGKTTLLHSVLSEIEATRLECVLISNPTLTRIEFYEQLVVGLGLSEAAAASKARFLLELRGHLIRRAEVGRYTAIVIDEAQSLPYSLLEEVRLLGNTETSTVKLLNIVLAGQPELANRLNEASLRQLKQRVTLRCQLKPFTSGETAAYIAGRLRIAGGDPMTIFSREAVEAIHDASKGVPRTINVVCDNALMESFARKQRPVTRSMVEAVCRDFEVPLSALTSVNGNGAEERSPTLQPEPGPSSSPTSWTKTDEALTAWRGLQKELQEKIQTEREAATTEEPSSLPRAEETVEPDRDDEVRMFQSVGRERRFFSFFS